LPHLGGPDRRFFDLAQFSRGSSPPERAFTRLRDAHLSKDVRGTVCEACVAYK